MWADDGCIALHTGAEPRVCRSQEAPGGRAALLFPTGAPCLRVTG